MRGVLRAENLGNAASETSALRVHFSTDDLLDAGDILLREAAVKAAKARKAKFKAKVEPGVLTTGGFVIAVFDAAGTNLECNEANNTVVSEPLP